MTDDRHHIDDPLMVVNTKPDFNGMGMKPIMTLKDFIGELPDCIKLLPEDWTGETIRIRIKLHVSKMAVKNKKFDLKGYLWTKFAIALKTVMKKKGMSEIRLTHNFAMTADDFSDEDCVIFYIHTEFER